MSAATIQASVAELVELTRTRGREAAQARAKEIARGLTYPECVVLKTEFWKALGELPKR